VVVVSKKKRPPQWEAFVESDAENQVMTRLLTFPGLGDGNSSNKTRKTSVESKPYPNIQNPSDL
jgi:hypothetical protein